MTIHLRLSLFSRTLATMYEAEFGFSTHILAGRILDYLQQHAPGKECPAEAAPPPPRPECWTIQAIAREFGATEKIVRECVALLNPKYTLQITA